MGHIWVIRASYVVLRSDIGTSVSLQKALKFNENNNLPKSKTLNQNSNEFPSVQLSVKNPISSKVLVFLMLLQVFSNIGIFMLLLNVLE